MAIAEHVRGTTKFSHYQAEHLYYTTDTNLTFPVPIEDAKGATFLAEDKSIFFMRWIRKHLETLKSS